MPVVAGQSVNPSVRDSAYVVAGATVVVFLCGYFQQISYFGQLGISPEALSFPLQYYMVQSINVLLVPLLAAVVAFAGRALGQELLFRYGLSTPARIMQRRNPKPFPGPLPIPDLAMAIALSSLMYHILAVQGLDGPKFYGTRILDIEIIAGVSLYAFLRTVSPLLDRVKGRERWKFGGLAGLALLVLIAAPLARRADILALGAGLAFLFIECAVTRPLRPKTGPFRQARYVYWCLASIVLLLVASILQGYYAGRDMADGCESVALASFQPAGVVPANNSYWVPLHADGVYYLRESQARAGDQTILALSDQAVTSVFFGPKAPLRADCP